MAGTLGQSDLVGSYLGLVSFLKGSVHSPIQLQVLCHEGQPQAQLTIHWYRVRLPSPSADMVNAQVHLGLLVTVDLTDTPNVITTLNKCTMELLYDCNSFVLP